MMNKLLGRVGNGNEVSDAVAVVNEEVMTANHALAEIAEELQSQREYIKAMEVRLHTRSEAAFNDLQKSFEKGIETAVDVIKGQLTSIQSSPEEVVVEIERRTNDEKKLHALKENKAELQSVVAECLVNDLPLVSEIAMYKYPQLTPQGEAVYDEVMRYIIQLAKITGRNKEYYTNTRMYQGFFKQFGIKRYGREIIRTAKGKTMKTLLATIILNGHIKQYVNYVVAMTDKEKALITGK